MAKEVNQREQEADYFQTTEEAVAHLKSIVPADIWRREFQGSYWDLIESKSPHSLDELIQSVLGDSTVRALIGTYLVHCVVPNLTSMVDEGVTYNPDTSDLIELDDSALAEIEALIPLLTKFAQDLQSTNGASMRIRSRDSESMTVVAKIAGHQRIMRFRVEAVMIGSQLCFSGVQNENTFVSGTADAVSGDGRINIVDYPPLRQGEFIHVVWAFDSETGAIKTTVDKQNDVNDQLEGFRGLLMGHLHPNARLRLVGPSADSGVPVASTLWWNRRENDKGWQGVTIGSEKIITDGV